MNASDLGRQKLTIVLNKESGTLKQLGSDKIKSELLQLLGDMGREARIHSVSGQELLHALKAARDDDSDAVLIGGGDGTVAAAASIFAGQSKPLGILPLGTFNLAARDLGVPLDREAAVRALVAAPVADIDLLEVGGRRYLCVIMLGFYPAMMIGRQEYHGWWIVKTCRTLLSSLKSAATFPPLAVQLHDGKQTHQHRTRMLLLANNDYEDMFGLLPIRRTLDAGHLTVYIASHRTRIGMLKSVINWILGRWKQDKEVLSLRATEIEINVRRKRRIAVMLDGEIEKMTLPLRIKVDPKALRVIVPRLAEMPPLVEI